MKTNGTNRSRSLLGIAFFILGISISGRTETLRVPKEHPTIQAAIGAAESGDVVLVSPGTYKERIRLKSGVTLRSLGDDKAKGKLGLKRAEATIIDGAFNSAEGAGVEMAEDSTLDGFTVTGIGKYDEALWKKHHATQGNQQSHEHIGVPGTAGIAVMGITQCTVKNNIVHHIGYTGIAIMGEKGKTVSPRIVNNITYRNMGGGIGSMKKSSATIEGNICFENFYAGIGMDDASPLVINNRCFQNIRAGIGVSEHSKPTVRGNKCYQNRRAGIGIRTGVETQPIVENNDCYQNDMSGIGTDEGASPVIRGNRCFENKMAGIGCQDESKPTITGNKCYRNKLSGIGSRGGAQALIKGNECYENGQSGIGQRGDAHTTLIDNFCHHNKAAGIGFGECKKGVSTVKKNRVIDNPTVAVGIHSGWKVTLTGNEFSRKKGMPPLVMVFKGAEASFSKNTFRSQGVAGIRVSGEVNLSENHFETASLRKVGPPSYAVWALEGSTVTMSSNHIESWRHALLATGATVTAHDNVVKNFFKTAFVINKPAGPVRVKDNKIESDDPEAKELSVDRETGGSSKKR